MSDYTIKQLCDLPDGISLSDSNVGWGCGGYGLRDNQWHIYVASDSDTPPSVVVYALPDIVSAMLNARFKHGEDELRRKIRTLLQIY